MSGSLPLIRPSTGSPRLVDWLQVEERSARDLLTKWGAIAFRGFRDGPCDLVSIVSMVADAPAVPYVDRTSPRRDRGRLRYSSTEHPSDQTIVLHSENSYQQSAPTHLAFACEVSAPTGGATTVCDGRAVLAALQDRVVERFRDGVIYRRCFHPGLGVPWTEAYQTDRREVVEQYAASSGIEVAWQGDRLTTWQRRPVIGADGTGRAAWANHVELFHPAGLDPRLREALCSLYGADLLPLDVRHADGTEISDAELGEIVDTTRTLTQRFVWEPGDVLILDNLRMMHGREPFTGVREVVVSMAGARDWSARAVTT